MDKEIELFITTLSQIGSRDDRELPAPIRNFFYSDKCYIALTIVPAIITGLVMFAVTPHTLLYRLATLILCFVVFLGGAKLYEYLNRRIQRYEGKVQSKST